MPYSRVSSCLAEMGIVVDRWSVRNYGQNNNRIVPAVDMFGVRVPLSIVSLSTLAAGMTEGGHRDIRELLAACSLPSGNKQLP
jgi:hypothetical protein